MLSESVENCSRVSVGPSAAAAETQKLLPASAALNAAAVAIPTAESPKRNGTLWWLH